MLQDEIDQTDSVFDRIEAEIDGRDAAAEAVEEVADDDPDSSDDAGSDGD